MNKSKINNLIEELILIRDKIIKSSDFGWRDADILAEVCNLLEELKGV